MSQTPILVAASHSASRLNRQKVGKAAKNNIALPTASVDTLRYRANLAAAQDALDAEVAFKAHKAAKVKANVEAKALGTAIIGGTAINVAYTVDVTAYEPLALKPLAKVKGKTLSKVGQILADVADKGRKDTSVFIPALPVTTGFAGLADAKALAKGKRKAAKLANVPAATERDMVRGKAEPVPTTEAALDTHRATFKAFAKADRLKHSALRTAAHEARLVAQRANRPSLPSMALKTQEPSYGPVVFNYKRLAINGQPTMALHTVAQSSLMDRFGRPMVTTVSGPIEYIEALDFSAHAEGRMNTRKGMTPLAKSGKATRSVSTGNMADDLFGKA